MRSNGPLANKKVAMGGRGWPGRLVASWPATCPATVLQRRSQGADGHLEAREPTPAQSARPWRPRGRANGAPQDRSQQPVGQPASGAARLQPCHGGSRQQECTHYLGRASNGRTVPRCFMKACPEFAGLRGLPAVEACASGFPIWAPRYHRVTPDRCLQRTKADLFQNRLAKRDRQHWPFLRLAESGRLVRRSTSDDSKTASRDPAAVRTPHPDIWRLWLPPMPSPGS
jgi:hypothetical protein